MEENEVERLLSKLTLMEKILMFYGTESNYEGDNPLIMMDKGSQARFVLDSIKTVDEYNNNIEKALKELKEESNGFEEINRILKKYSNK